MQISGRIEEEEEEEEHEEALQHTAFSLALAVCITSLLPSLYI